MIDGTAVNAIAELAKRAQDAKERVTEIGEQPFSTTELIAVEPPCEPAPEILTVSSLLALADYLLNNPDGLPLPECVLHIESPTSVALRSKLLGYHKQRFHYVRAVAAWTDPAFRFGIYQPHADFVTGLMSLFTDAGDRGMLMQMIRRIQMTSSVQVGDDGVTQSVEAKKGVSLVEDMALPPQVQLAPYRSFPEIEQPTSAYLLRARFTEGRGFEVALFDADGGWWRIEAVRRIRNWLAEALTDAAAEPQIIG
jgi:hypothetical protein